LRLEHAEAARRVVRRGVELLRDGAVVEAAQLAAPVDESQTLAAGPASSLNGAFTPVRQTAPALVAVASPLSQDAAVASTPVVVTAPRSNG
jgi:hypothetical protein